MRRHEVGHTITEVVVAAACLAVLVVLYMPSATGYQNSAQVRAVTAQAIADFREAQEIALAQGASIRLFLNVADRPPEGYTVAQLSSGKTLWQVKTPPGWNMWAPCYSALFDSYGAYQDWCGSTTTPFEAFCIETHAGSNNNIATQFWIVLATGQITSKQKPVGQSCP